MLEWTYKYRDAVPAYHGETLDEVQDRLLEMGHTIWFSDMRTTMQTTRHKMHGVYVIIFLADYDGRWNLLTGTYNYLCALEGADSTLFHAEIKQNPVLQSDQRWSLWDNPMRNRRPEAWSAMWKGCRTFESYSDLSEYILSHMKNWDDIGTTLYEFNRGH